MAGGKGKIHLHPKANTAGFKQNPQNIDKTGSNRKIITSVLLDMNIRGIDTPSAAEIKEVFLKLCTMTKPELAIINADETEPMIMRIVAEALLSKRGIDAINFLLDRAIGKPNQAVDITSKGEKISILTQEKDV